MKNEIPRNMEAERYTLVLLAKGHISTDEIKYEDFYDPKNRLIFKSIIKLKDHIPVDSEQIWKELEKEGNNTDAGTSLYITDVIEGTVVRKEQSEYWLNELKEVSLSRKTLKTARQIEDSIMSGKPIKEVKEKVDDLTNNLKGVDTKKKKKVKYIAKFDGLIDLVEDNSEVKFLVLENNILQLKDEVEIDGEKYLPPTKKQLPIHLLPRASEVIDYYTNDNDSKLFDDLTEYHKNISQLPTERHYLLLASWVMHTYLMEKFQYSPYIWLFAIPERGKSRTGKGCTYIAYRGLHVESLRESYLFRTANNLGSALFIDVMDLWKKAEKAGSEDILLTRYEKGIKVPRVEHPDKGPFQDTVYYDDFGPTIIGTNFNVHPILETRSILINMPETDKEFEDEVTPEKALPLKERLVAFRARNYHLDFTPTEKPVKGRLGDITKPLFQIVHYVKREMANDFLKLIHEIDSQRKLSKSDSFEAKLLSTVIELEDQVSSGILYVKDITNYYNRNQDDKFEASTNKVGWRLGALGFVKGKDRNGAYIQFDEDLIAKLEEKLGLKKYNNEIEDNSPVNNLRLTSLTSSSSQTQYL